jgi:hypothetical protein
MCKAAHFLLLLVSTLSTGCGGGGTQPAASKLVHSPPIKQLSAQQLRALSMECEKYSPTKTGRGPYDAAYCEEAMAAWGDWPLQIVTVDGDGGNPAPAAPVTPAAPAVPPAPATPAAPTAPAAAGARSANPGKSP